MDVLVSPSLLLRTSQVAQLLNMHPTTVHRLIRQGKLRVYARTPGGYALFQHNDVLAYRASLLVAAAPIADEKRP